MQFSCHKLTNLGHAALILTTVSMLMGGNSLRQKLDYKTTTESTGRFMDKMMKKKVQNKNICTFEKKNINIIDKQYCIAQPYTEINSPLLLKRLLW